MSFVLDLWLLCADSGLSVCLISRSVGALSCPAVCRRGSQFGCLLDFALVQLVSLRPAFGPKAQLELLKQLER